MNTIKSILLLLSFWMAPTLSQASEPVTVSVRSGQYLIQIDGWRLGEDILSRMGNRDLTISNERGEVLDQKVPLNNLNEDLLIGTGSNYDYLIAFGEGLQNIGGLEGFKALLEVEFGILVEDIKNTPGVKTDFVMVMTRGNQDDLHPLFYGKMRIQNRR